MIQFLSLPSLRLLPLAKSRPRNGWKGGEWRKLREMFKTFNQAMREQKDALR